MSRASAVKSSAGMQPPPRAPRKETWQEQISSFVGFFVYLLILKTFFLPLFIIPTGSMAQTLYGEHSVHTCPNCGYEYPVAWQPQGLQLTGPYQPVVQCPNCRWREYYGDASRLANSRPQPDARLAAPLRPIAGDRIFVHGWPFEPLLRDLPGLGPDRWDVVVFKVPTDGETNYIKRLIGLPNEKVELINGDVFINDELVTKTDDAQVSLWFPYFDTNYLPREPAGEAQYHPRWIPVSHPEAWSGVGDDPERVIRFAPDGAARSAIQFATDPLRPREPGLIQDVYAYNEPGRGPHDVHARVSDVRLSAEVRLTANDPAGYVELSWARPPHRFAARLDAGGSVTLRASLDGGEPESWGTWAVRHDGPVHLALSHVDGTVNVEVGGRTAITTRNRPELYRITPDDARRQASDPRTPVLRVAAANTRVTLRHLLIERDVYYRSRVKTQHGQAYGVEGNPIHLGENDYYLLGDNSPNSQDGRYAFAPRIEDAVGPHLRHDYEQGEFHLGTVPGDQLIGPAFFVYWPGFLPLTPQGPNILPDLGRARWIR